MKDVKKLLKDSQIQTLKQELVQQQKQLQEHLHQDLDNLHHTNERDNSGELSLYDNHPADMGTELYEREKDFAIDDHAKLELNKIQHALEAISEGSYGTCKECGGDIPYEGSKRSRRPFTARIIHLNNRSSKTGRWRKMYCSPCRQ